MGLSRAQEVALLSPEEREAVLEDIDMAALEYNWDFWGRPEQRPPDDASWAMYLMLSGRGSGKSKSGAEWVRKKALQHPGCRITLVARTAADVRNVMIDGESGIMAVHAPSEMPKHEPTKTRLTWPNGSVATTFSSDVPDSLRGPQSHYTWVDELASWRHVAGIDGVTAWGHVQIGTRLGDNPQIFVTTTPKRIPVIRDLIEKAKDPDERIIIVHGSTKDNAGNLSQGYLDKVYGLFGGTQLAQQELEGLLADEAEGALWSSALIDGGRRFYDWERLPLRVIAVDPSVAERPRDECGIVVVGATGERLIGRRTAYVIEDATLDGPQPPSKWTKAVVEAAKKYDAPVIAEINNGGALVTSNILAVDPTIKIFTVSARQGKALRAEPVANLYEQMIPRVRHMEEFGLLESQMTTWVPAESKDSPDRIDALVYGVMALLIKPPKGFSKAVGATQSTGSSHLPQGRLPRSRRGANPRGVQLHRS